MTCKCTLSFANASFPTWPISTFQTLASFFIRLSKRPCHCDNLSSSRHRLLNLPDPRCMTQRWQSVDPACIGQAVKENAPCVLTPYGFFLRLHGCSQTTLKGLKQVDGWGLNCMAGAYTVCGRRKSCWPAKFSSERQGASPFYRDSVVLWQV